MHRRHVLALVAVAILAATAGCTTFFGGISDEDLDRQANYEDLRDRGVDVAVDVEGGEFRAVYDLEDTESLSLYRSSIYRDEAMDVHGVRYWYPNGTGVMGSELEVDQGRSSTDIRVPDGNGTIAFSGSAGSRTFDLPAFVTGSYEVTLPPGYRTTNVLFGDVSPGGYERELIDDRERLTWEENGSSIFIRFYLPRDLLLFAGLVAILATVGGGGLYYYYRQVQRLRERREEMGLDVESEETESDDRGPPPGAP